MEASRLALLAALAALAAYAGLHTSSASGGASTIDGIAFPSQIKAFGTVQTLCGGGTRLKYNVVKVYAVGLYFEPQAATRAGGSEGLRRFVSTPPKALAKSKPFYDALVSGRFAKSVVLQFHRSVAAEAVAGAMKDALSKKVGPSSLAKFSDTLVRVLGDGSIPRGGKLSFHCKADAMQIGFGDATPGPAIKEKGLCTALFGVYYGSSPISPSAKDAAATAFAEVYGAPTSA